MNTLSYDLLGLIDNYLNIAHVILLNPSKEIADLNPSTNFKVWLHMFDKGYFDKPLKILYKKGDIKTLQFISHYYHRCRHVLDIYFELLNIKSGIISVTYSTAHPMYALYIKEIIKYACKHNKIDIIEEIHGNDYYFGTGPHMSYLYKCAYKYQCTEIIDYNNLIGYYPACEAVGIIGSNFNLKDLDTLDQFGDYEGILDEIIINGADDRIVDEVLQKWPQQVTSLEFGAWCNSNIKCTIESFIKIKEYMGGFSAQDIQHLTTAFITSGRYDLLTMIMTI